MTILEIAISTFLFVIMIPTSVSLYAIGDYFRAKAKKENLI